MASVIIAIQARSTSERLPGKVLMDIEGKPLLQYVIDECKKCAQHVELRNTKVKECRTVVVCPTGDKLISVFNEKVPIFQGPEHDVLSRFYNLAQVWEPTYIVRISGDCPLIQSTEITKHINTAVMNDKDYTSNVQEEIRTVYDGADIEVLSARALQWLNTNAKDPKDREHVTTLLRRQEPPWLKVAHVISRIYTADTMLSVNTQEDLDRVRFHVRKIKEAEEWATKRHGRESVFKY